RSALGGTAPGRALGPRPSGARARARRVRGGRRCAAGSLGPLRSAGRAVLAAGRGRALRGRGRPRRPRAVRGGAGHDRTPTDRASQIASDAEAEASDGLVVDVVDIGQLVEGGGIDAEATLGALEGALARALERGHAGLRVVALLTHIATEPFLRQSWAAWEHVVGEWQSLRPVASACSFDRRVLGDKAVQELACLHPRVLTRGPDVPFRLFFR